MRAWCGERTTQEALVELRNAGLPAGPVLTPQMALDDVQVAAMGFLHAIGDFPGLPRAAPVPDLPVRLSRSGGGIERRPPLLGEHTDEILRSIGMTEREIVDLRAQRII